MLAISEISLAGGSLFDMQATHHLTGHAGNDFVVESRRMIGLISQSQVDDRDVAESETFGHCFPWGALGPQPALAAKSVPQVKWEPVRVSEMYREFVPWERLGFPTD